METHAQGALDLGILFGQGKKFGKGALLVIQNAYTKTRRLFQHCQHARLSIHANKNQKRIQRNRSKRISGHTVNLPRCAFGSHNRYAGGKSPKRLAKYSAAQ